MKGKSYSFTIFFSSAERYFIVTNYDWIWDLYDKPKEIASNTVFKEDCVLIYFQCIIYLYIKDAIENHSIIENTCS